METRISNLRIRPNSNDSSEKYKNKTLLLLWREITGSRIWKENAKFRAF